VSTYCAEVLSPAPVQVLLIRQRPDGSFSSGSMNGAGRSPLRSTTRSTKQCATLTRNTAESPIADSVRMMSIHSSTSGRDLTPERPHISMRGGGKR